MATERDSRMLRQLWGLEPGVRFLNHGSFGACPTAVLETQRELRDRMEREPVRFFARELDGLRDAAKEDLATFLGADARDLGFVPNATTGVNAVLRSLDLGPGQDILVTNQGYNACRNAVEFVCARAGARVIVAEMPFPIASEDEVLEAITGAITPTTRLALIDHITSATGLVLPIQRIVDALRDHGVETLVDGAHAPGMLALDLGALDAAYYTGNCHKWLCAPKGAAFLHVRRELQDSVRPAVISHGANSPQPGRSRYQVEFDWVGTDDPTAYLAVPEAIRYMRSLLPGGWPEIRERNRGLALQARDLLVDALGIEPPAPDGMIGSLASVPLPSGDPDAPASAFDTDPQQAALFRDHGIEVPIMGWPGPPERVLRVSAQLYNDLEEYRALASALEELLAASS